MAVTGSCTGTGVSVKLNESSQGCARSVSTWGAGYLQLPPLVSVHVAVLHQKPGYVCHHHHCL